MPTTPHPHPIRTRGPLELRSDHTILLHGYEIEAVGLTADPKELQVRTTENEQLQQLASSDFLYIMTGLESLPAEQAQHLFKTYLLLRGHISELVEAASWKPVVHPTCLCLLLHHQSEPFFTAVEQAKVWLDDLSQVPSIRAQDVPQVFAASLLTISRLAAMLDAFKAARLGLFVSQIVEGNDFLGLVRRAQQTVESAPPMLRARVETPPQFCPEVLLLLLLALLGLCVQSWWCLRGRTSNSRARPREEACRAINH